MVGMAGAIIPEFVLLIFIASDGTRQRLERMDRRGTVSITMLAVVSIANAIALGAMIGSLITGRERAAVSCCSRRW